MNMPLALRPHESVSTFTEKDISLIRRTMAKGATDDEFNVFMKMAIGLRLNPLKRQIYCFIYNADKPEKRNMVLVTAITGFRAIADRTCCYRPDDKAPEFYILPWKVSRDNAINRTLAKAEEIDDIEEREAYLAKQKAGIDRLYPIDPLNPQGIEKVVVRVFKFAHGEWHTVTAEAYWTEYAPIKDEWADVEVNGKMTRRPNGRKTLDTSGQWGKMGHNQIEKCAEAKALRKAWPDDLSNVYGEEEVDRQKFIDLTPSEISDIGTQQARLERVEAKDCLLISWTGGATEALENVPMGSFADRVFAFIAESKEEPSSIMAWKIRNRHELNKFHALRKTDALAIKRELEKVEAAALVPV